MTTEPILCEGGLVKGARGIEALITTIQIAPVRSDGGVVILEPEGVIAAAHGGRWLRWSRNRRRTVRKDQRDTQDKRSPPKHRSSLCGHQPSISFTLSKKPFDI